jgi:hypothetical protein
VNGVVSRPFTAGSAVDLDVNLRIASTSLIRVDMNVAYVPLMAWTITNKVNKVSDADDADKSVTGLMLSTTAFGRVRQGPSLPCADC